MAPLHLWLWPTKLWQRLHLDFAGPFQGRMYLLVSDTLHYYYIITPPPYTINILHHLYNLQKHPSI